MTVPTEHSPAAPIEIRRMVVTALIVTIISLLWTVLMPGVVAGVDGVFYRDGILQKIPSEAKEKLASFNKQQDQLKAQITATDDALSKVAIEKTSDVSALLQIT